MKRSLFVGPILLGAALLPAAHYAREQRVEAHSVEIPDCVPGKTSLDIETIHMDADPAHDIMVPVEVHHCGGKILRLRAKVD